VPPPIAPPFLSSWDTGEPGAFWDAGFQWDVNVGPPLGNPAPWLALVTSEHADKPNFMAMMTALLQPFADMLALCQIMSGYFDLDNAVGQQLDTLGLWIGITRLLRVQLPNTFFSLDTVGQGFDQAVWWNSSQPLTGVVTLADSQYRTLLQGRIVVNRWDGSVPGAYAAFATAFQGTGFGILIQDYQDMTMAYALTGPIPDAVTLALFTGGLLTPRPAGVRVRSFMTPTVSNVPYFGLDAENSGISGFDVGAWGAIGPGI
jgi:hypothetical protein